MSSFLDSTPPAGGGGGGDEMDPEVQNFLAKEQQRAVFNATVHQLNDVCWEKCMDKPGSKLDSRTESCMMNCVDRFVDVTLSITTRFAQLMQKQAGGY